MLTAGEMLMLSWQRGDNLLLGKQEEIKCK
jgi:hypothetical protein